MTFKEKLVILRKSKGLTQDEFASAVGVSRQAVYKWESGQSYPEVPKLLEMKLLFTISIDELLDDNYDIPLPEKKKRKRAPKVESATPKAAAAPKEVPVPKAEPVVTPIIEEPEVEVEIMETKVEEPKIEIPVAPVINTIPEVKATPKIEIPVISETEVPVAQSAPIIDTVPAPSTEELIENTTINLDDFDTVDEQDNSKKTSFFGRLFGRK